MARGNVKDTIAQTPELYLVEAGKKRKKMICQWSTKIPKNETQKVKDQLQCLIYLVKRAWSGDYIAAVHVSNIVGVPPPEFKKKDPERINVSPQPDPVSNWAKLCIGVLNKMYREEELELRASQLMYLQDREGYLDDELASHSDLVRHQSSMALLKTNTFQLLQAKEEEERKERQERLEQLEKQKQELQLQHRKTHPHRNHLTKKPSRESVQQAAKLNTDDSLFVVTPVSRRRTTSSGLKKQQHLNVEIKEKGNYFDEYEEVADETSMACDDRNSLTFASREDKQLKKNNRPVTSINPITKPRAKSAGQARTTPSRPRPRSAHSAKPSTSATNRRKHIDLIEKDLKLTTKTLQDRLGISKEGMV